MTAKMASALGSMNWSLIRFGSPALATSDHPVAVWPPSAAGRPAQVTLVQEIGVGNVLEIRFPVSPGAAILMTWRERPDDHEPLDGKTHHAENLNAFTIAQAVKQWFYKLGARRPRQPSGIWLPLAPELLPGYSIYEAAPLPASAAHPCGSTGARRRTDRAVPRSGDSPHSVRRWDRGRRVAAPIATPPGCCPFRCREGHRAETPISAQIASDRP